MFNRRDSLEFLVMVVVSCALSIMLMSQLSFASQVRVCKKIKKAVPSTELSSPSSKTTPKKIYCSVQPKIAAIGDYVEIKDTRNYTVAIGRVVRQGATSTIIVLKKYLPEVGSMTGYPVMIRREGDQNYWSASTAPI